MHRGGDRWLVDNRAFLWREHGEELSPPRGFALTNVLGGVKVMSGTVEQSFAIPEEDER